MPRRSAPNSRSTESRTTRAPGSEDSEKLFASAQAFQQSGDTRKAREIYRKLLKRSPGQPMVTHFLGMTYLQDGVLDNALRCINESLRLAPGTPMFLNNLGLVHRARGDQREAESCFAQARDSQPDYPEAWFNLAVCYEDSGRINEAIVAYRRVISINPRGLNAYKNLGLLLSATGRPEQAEQCYRQALDVRPDQLEIRAGLALALVQQAHYEEAKLEYARFKDFSDGSAAHLTVIARIELLLGEIQAAIQNYQIALVTDPNYIDALLGRLRAAPVRAEDRPLVDRAIEMLRRNDLTNRQRINLCFVVGRALDGLGDYEQAFDYFSRANKLRRAGLSFDRQRQRRFTQTMIDCCNSGFFSQRTDYGLSAEAPIFIIGMPRSGTTLVEQILSAQPQVFAAGELTLVGNIARERREAAAEDAMGLAWLITLDKAASQNLARQYLRALPHQEASIIRVTDKMPANFLWLGLIHLMFPNARVVHCHRDPLDVGLSIFFHDFGMLYPYAYDLEDIGCYYSEYLRLMAHWRSVLPADFIFDLSYEQLVAVPETNVARLLAHCGLQWDERCLRFFEKQRPIATASHSQVRQPLYDSSINRWKHYQPYLQPLVDAINTNNQG
jgi:tetratricopeptide (TPR) repeat protein